MKKKIKKRRIIYNSDIIKESIKMTNEELEQKDYFFGNIKIKNISKKTQFFYRLYLKIIIVF